MASIITAAAVCGMGAFVWALANARPPARSWRGAGVPTARTAPAERPIDLEGLEAYVGRNPDDVDAWFSLAERRRDAGNLGGERDAWARVKDLASLQTQRQREDPRGWFTLAWASDKLVSEDGAPAWLRACELYEARADSPRSASWRFWQRLGWCRDRTGKPEAAREAWRQSLALLKTQAGTDADAERSRQLLRATALAGQSKDALELLERTAMYWDPAALAHDESLTGIRGSERFRAAAAQAKPHGRLMDAR